MANPFAPPELPPRMRAVVMDGYGPPSVLRLAEVPTPTLTRGDTDVIVEVHAAGANPFETKLRRGFLHPMFPLPPGHILGNDLAGVVVHAGFDVHEVAKGDRVFGVADTMRPGAGAEYTVQPGYRLRRMPANLSFTEAAAIPTPACTAWFALHHLGHIASGQRVLIHGGAGGVGSFAVQIAKLGGAHVTTTSSAANLEYCRSLGADEAVDYAATDFTTIAPVDLVLDPIGGEVGQRSYTVLKRGGTLLVTVRGDMVEIPNRHANMAKYGVTTREVAFSAEPSILDLMRPLFESGALRVPELTVLPLEQASQAHTQLETGHTRGKIVLQVR